MFETAEVGNKVDKKDYAKEAPKIREQLLEIQKQLATAKLRVIVIIGGVEGAGKAETVNLLLEWMDARGIQVHAMWEPSDEERERPPMWRFWRVLPPAGRIGIFFGSWYTNPIIDRVFNRTDDAELDQSLDRITDFERMLTNEDTLIIKLWMHLSKKAQRKRLKELEDDPKQRWRVTKMDWKFFRKYDKFRRVSETALRRTNTGESAWNIVEARDPRYRTLTVTRTILAALKARLAKIAATPKAERSPDLPKPKKVNIIRSLDYSKKLDENEYEKQLLTELGDVNLLARKLHDQRRSMLCVFEGPDAGGKGGAIRRLISAMDSRNYQVISIAAPTDEERARPYLWRFWRHLPRLGRITVFDRSWYGRVLVERLEGFCAKADWERAYNEINAFEQQLTDFGVIIRKFWLATTADEQLRRFKDREVTPYKQYKITEEDWRNRNKWDGYEAAACDMIEKCSTESSPWVLVEANDKNWARIKILKTVEKALKKALD